MLELVKKNVVPPGGYRFLVEESGLEVKANDIHSLVINVRQHLAVNNMTISLPDGVELHQFIEDQMCKRLESSFCKDVGAVTYFSKRNVGSLVQSQTIGPALGTTVLNRTLAIISKAKQRFGLNFLVDQTTANARSERALLDSLAVNYSGCYSCKHEGPVSQSMGSRRRTINDNKLRVCGVFNAYLVALVHIRAEALTQYLPKGFVDSIDDSFWLKPEMKQGE